MTVLDIVDCEGSYINTSHPDFVGPHTAMASEVFIAII